MQLMTKSDPLLPATEFEFMLPRGLVDAEGKLHRQGVMRLATARDEILMQKNRYAQENLLYGNLVMLAQVITRLGNLSSVTPEQLEDLFTLDLAYLQDFYNQINQQNSLNLAAQCPHCHHQFEVEVDRAGE